MKDSLVSTAEPEEDCILTRRGAILLLRALGGPGLLTLASKPENGSKVPVAAEAPRLGILPTVGLVAGDSTLKSQL